MCGQVSHSYVSPERRISLEETNSVDIVLEAFPGDDVDVVLVIVDTGSVHDPQQRYDLLIAKLKTYAAYMMEQEPARTRVRVLHKSPATPQMLQVQSIAPRGHEDRRAAVVFEDYDAAMAQLKARVNPPIQRSGAAGIVSIIEIYSVVAPAADRHYVSPISA